MLEIDARRNREMLDHHDIAKLVTGVARSLDAKTFDDLAHFYVADAILTTPGGDSAGIGAIIELARNNHEMFAHTQHLVSGIGIDLDGDRATGTANVVAVFVPKADEPSVNRMIGTRYIFDAERGAVGWRFTNLEITPLWEYAS